MTVLRCVTLKVRPYQTQNLGERRISGVPHCLNLESKWKHFTGNIYVLRERIDFYYQLNSFNSTDILELLLSMMIFNPIKQ